MEVDVPPLNRPAAAKTPAKTPTTANTPALQRLAPQPPRLTTPSSPASEVFTLFKENPSPLLIRHNSLLSL